MKRIDIILVIGIIMLIANGSAQACRFNVRDVGFVDFGRENYTLNIVYNNETREDIVESLKQISFAALLDSNIETQHINLDEQSTHPIINQIDKHNVQDYPALILESPREHSTVLELNDPSSKDEIWTVMEELVSSDLREEILNKTLRTYGVVLFVEGNDQEQTALNNVKKAMQDIENSMDRLPKEIKEPPVLMTVSKDERTQEPTLLWSLGIPSDSQEPHVAILYGRGRLIGDVLSGKQISKERTKYILSVVGLSCECGLDRTWLLGQMVPLRWDSVRQQTATRLLSFDTENPMIKTEMSQIMAQGEGAPPAGSTSSRSQSQLAMNDPLMGYSEMSVMDSQSPATEMQPEETVEPTQAPTMKPIAQANTEINQNSMKSTTTPQAQVQQTSQSSPSQNSNSNFIPSLPVLFLFGVGALIILGGIIIGIRGTSS